MNKIIIPVLLITVLCVNVFGANTTFLHHFDKVTAPTLEERFIADYAKGDPVPVSITQSELGPWPDVTSAGEVKFGSGSYKGTETYRETTQLAFKAENNVSFAKGSFEAWVYLTADDDYFKPFYLANHTQTRKILLMANGSTSGGRCWWIGRQVYGVGALPSEYVKDLENDLVTDQWQFLAADWKLDSANAAENFLRLWVDGRFVGETNNIPQWDSLASEADSWLGIFTSDAPVTSGLRGYGDEFRITDGLISDLYALDGSSNFTSPAAPFTTPDYVDCADALKHGWGSDADIYADCYVDFKDFSEIADGWLDCMDPAGDCDF